MGDPTPPPHTPTTTTTILPDGGTEPIGLPLLSDGEQSASQVLSAAADEDDDAMWPAQGDHQGAAAEASAAAAAAAASALRRAAWLAGDDPFPGYHKMHISHTRNAHAAALHPLECCAYPPLNNPSATRYDDMDVAPGSHPTRFCASVGRLPDNISAQHIAWAVDLLLQQPAVRGVRSLGTSGVARVWVEDEEQLRVLHSRSRHMWFDVCNVWVARTPADVARVAAYEVQLQSSEQFGPRFVRRAVEISEPVDRPRSAPDEPHRGAGGAAASYRGRGRDHHRGRSA